MKVAIIGSGIGGICSAIRLKKKGFDVDVFEKNEFPGGKLSTFKLGDFRFDAGPSLFTMPHLVDELFTICDENPRNFFNYKKKKFTVNIFGMTEKNSLHILIKINFLMKLKKNLMFQGTSLKNILTKLK